MVHRSKKDLWLVLLLGVGIAGPAVAGVATLVGSSGTATQGLVLILSSVAVGGLVALLGWPTRYEVMPGALRIRSGVLRYEIALASIQAIAPSRNPLSAPAWSLDRLRIDYREGPRMRMALISPEDKAAFLADVARAEPSLRPTGTGSLGRAG